MSTELKPVVARNASVLMTQFGGGEDGRCVQLSSSSFNQPYLQLTVDQAKELAAALLEFVEGSREDYLGYPCGKFSAEQ